MSTTTLEAILFAFLIVVPFVALLVEGRGSKLRMEERHHSHHDTYVISPGLSHVLVNSMIIMAIAGILLGLLAFVDLFEEPPIVIMSFFAAYIVVTFVMWYFMMRYKVSVYEDHLEVTPIIGEKKSVTFGEIDSMRLVTPRLGLHRDVHVYKDGSRVITIWGMVDVNQILVRINRFDVLVGDV